MELKTKFEVGDTVYFLYDNELYKGVVNNIRINVASRILEIYEVSFTSREDYCELKEDIGADNLFKSAKDVIDNLMLDFEKQDEVNE